MKKQTDKQIEIMYMVSASIIVMLTVLSFIYCYIWEINKLRPSYIIDVSIDITGMILCGVLIFSLANDKPWDIQNRSLFRLIFTLCLLFHFDSLSSFLEGRAEYARGVILSNFLLFFAETLLIYCFWTYIREELQIDKKKIPVINSICRIALVIELVLDVLNIKFGFFFTVDASGEYVAGSLEGLAELSTFIIYLIIWIVILRAKNRPLREKAILLSFQVFPIIANVLGLIFGDYASVFPSYLFSIMLIYINVFAVRSRKLLEQQAELDKQRTMLMVSQIQPHFLYNVLTTISNLCVTDPEEAEETTVLFSQYLRTNLDSLRKSEPVPFKTELGHIRTYVELEKKRFKDKLNVEIDCPETDFLVPALGLQPIVENSVKHGIRGKDAPGHLKISDRKLDGGVEVIIEDDGVGFDMNAPLPDDGRSHVGMINVKSRLQQMCDAKVTVESSPGKGCKTVIFFPEK